MGKRRQNLNKLPTVFVDSSVFFTAVNSPTGGSAKIFSLNHKAFELITSLFVLTETERNVRNKLLFFHLDRFFNLVEQITIFEQKLDTKIIESARKAIVEKDAVILAEAKQASSNYLLTLDIKHFKTKPAQDFAKPTQIVTPKELLRETT
ncbi:PIN domain-containing protein [Patescibacteria group bacterium]|nr:PIN domain-containing protein [Patescibacteria group bacterium]